MKKTTTAAKVYTFGLTSCLLTSFATAQLFIHQPFDYTNGTTFLAASPLPVGIASHSGADAGILATSALTYPGTLSSGNGYGPLNNGRSFMNVDLSTPSLSSYVSGGLVGGSGSGTLYISWMIKGANNGSATMLELKNSANGDASLQLGTLFSGEGFRLVASGQPIGGDPSYQGSNISPSAFGVDFLVAKIDFGPGNTDRVSLFINQVNEGSPNVQSGADRNVKFNQIVFASFGANQSIFDQMRVGATFGDVAPAAVVLPPAAPSGLNLVANSFSDISLTWSDNSNNEIGFDIERSPDGTGSWTSVALAGTNATSYQDTGLSAGTQYFYRLSAYNSGGYSPLSNIASATTGPLPPLVPLTTVTIPFADADATPAASAALVTGVLAYSGSGVIETTSALSYTVVASSGNGLKTAHGRYNIRLDTTLPGYERYLSGGLIGGSGDGTLYVSWLARGINGNEANEINFKAGTADNQSSVFVGTTFGNPTIAAGSANTLNGGIANYSGSGVPPSVGTDFYVAKFTFGAGNTSLVEVFVNQITEGSADLTTTGFAAFNTIGTTKFGPAAAPSIDEIRIGTSFEAVTGNSGSSGLVTFRANNDLAADGSGDLLTPAADGVNNLLKYAFNMIGDSAGQAASLSTPNVGVLAASGLAGLPRQGLNAGALTITYIRHQASLNPGVTYAVKFSSSLAAFTVNPASAETFFDLGGGFERVTVTDSIPASAKRFARVEVIGN